MPRALDNLAAGARAALQLCRAGLSLTVAAAAAAGAWLAPRADQALIVFAGVLLLACGCSALNQVQERDLDRVCARTRSRPLPSGVLLPSTALALAGLLLVAGLLVLLVVPADYRGAAWALAAVVLYCGVYTPLKRHTAVAFLPGAVAGALPPLVGASAAGGIVPAAVLLAGAILVWQVPHYWLVQLRHRDDFHRLPVPVFCRAMSTDQLRRLVFTWAAAFAALPPALLLLVDGHARRGLPQGALLLSVVLTAAGVPLLGKGGGTVLYRRLEVILRLGLLALLVLVAIAGRALG